MARIGNVIKLVGMYFKLNLSGALEYRASFVIQVLGMALNNATFVFFWWVIFDKVGGNIGGYDFRDVMFIWAATSSAFGFAHVVFGNMSALTGLIVSGELDTFLLQPKSVLVNMLCARTNLSAWGDFAYGFVLMALTGQGGAGWAAFLLAIAAGGLLIAAIAVTAHTLTFYFGDASLAGGMAVEFVINFCIYPQGIYQGVIRAIMFTVIPASFIVHVPLQLARAFDARWLLLMLAATAAYCSFSAWFFYRGLKRYESGNLIVTRM